MDRLKLLSIVLLAVLVLVPGAEAKSGRVLLQEGLYAEQTEGDLEKAIGIYGQVLDEYKEVERIAARATYQLGMCWLKKGDNDKAAEYFTEVVEYYPEQKAAVRKAEAQLERIGFGTVSEASLWGIMGDTISGYIGSKYGEICAEAGMKRLYSNSHIYLVDSELVLHGGGMGYIYNWTGQPITERYRISGTTRPNHKLYDIEGNRMDIDIEVDEGRKGFYHVYWNPKEPLGVWEFFNYGWVTEGSTKLSNSGVGTSYPITMQNKFGDHAYETFFLVVPEGMVLESQSEEYTKMKNLEGWDIYWWKKEVPANTDHVVNVTLRSEVIMTQELHNTIDAEGLIHFKSPNRISNNGSEPITTTRFINSDFVSLTKMYEEGGNAIPFETTHEGNIFRYNITFNKPIMPGESMVYYTEGTMRGLITPIPGKKEVLRYFMMHSPATNRPVLRIETFLLPEGAIFVSTSTPNIEKTEKDGRIEIRVEEVIPANGSIATEFQYELSGATLVSAEPLQLGSVPFFHGERMRLSLKSPAGGEIGQMIWQNSSVEEDGKYFDRIESWMHIGISNMQQYTAVDVDRISLKPIRGVTKNWMGEFHAQYNDSSVTLTSILGGKESTKEFPVTGAVFDNEQALFVIRALPLEVGYSAEFDIFPVQSGSVAKCRINVTETEKVSWLGGEMECFAVTLSCYLNAIKVLEHRLWISTDKRRWLVKYDSGQAIMELTSAGKVGLDEPVEVLNIRQGYKFLLPVGWQSIASPAAGTRMESTQLLPPALEGWAVFTAIEKTGLPDSVRQIAQLDAEELKGFFKNYVVRETSWEDLTLDGMEAAIYIADYEDKGKEMVEYRSYILGDSLVYWFVFRVAKDRFEDCREEFDSIVNSFSKIRPMPFKAPDEK